MIRNKRFFIFVLITIIVQVIFTRNFNLINTQFPFLDGVPIASYSLEYRYLLNWYLPIISMSFYFSGYLNNMILVYSTVFFVRTYSKTIWAIKQYWFMLIILLLFIVFQSTIFILLDGSGSPVPITTIMKSFSIYFLTLFVLFSIQLLLELYIRPELSQLIINLYVIFSIVITKEHDNVSNLLNYLFLPNYGMGFRNGLSHISQFEIDSIDYFHGLFILLIMQFTIIALTVKRIKKMDLI